MNNRLHAHALLLLSVVLGSGCAPADDAVERPVAVRQSPGTVVAEFVGTARAGGLELTVQPVANTKDSICQLRVTSGRPNTIGIRTDFMGQTPAECGVPDAPPFSEVGVFCADIAVINFYDRPLPEAAAEITSVAPTAGAMPWRAPWVLDQEPSPIPEDTALATIPHGDIDVGGEGLATWRFQQSAGEFTFTGRVIAHFEEDPTNGIDDDCDGLVDEVP